VKGQIRLVTVGNSAAWLTFNVTSRTDHTNYVEFALTNTGSSTGSPFITATPLLLCFTRTGDQGTAGTTGGTGAAGPAGANGPGYVSGGRLTLTTGTPYMTANNTLAQATIYYTPATGDTCLIYDGTNMVPTTFAEYSQALSDTAKSPAATAASSLYDMFAWNDAGTFRCTRGPAWTNGTTRSAGTALVRVKGVLVNNAAITNGPAAQRGTYVGTIQTDGSITMQFHAVRRGERRQREPP
jgi:putative flippase GtrA